jgi:hypothetical protein
MILVKHRRLLRVGSDGSALTQGGTQHPVAGKKRSLIGWQCISTQWRPDSQSLGGESSGGKDRVNRVHLGGRTLCPPGDIFP